MKPGKPTTFATISTTSTAAAPADAASGAATGAATKTCCFFALPGNPVSCLVTKALLVDPMLKRLQGLSVAETLYPEIRVAVETALELDSERPEYHR